MSAHDPDKINTHDDELRDEFNMGKSYGRFCLQQELMPLLKLAATELHRFIKQTSDNAEACATMQTIDVRVKLEMALLRHRQGITNVKEASNERA
jgi:hypothetical protein